MLYIHIGMHKTGTTFLQRQVFPKWKGIEYLGTLIYGRKLVTLNPDKDYLLSDEFICGNPWKGYRDQELRIMNLSKMFPDVRILISFRKHDGFILSLYKQYLHEGGILPFDQFFSFDNENSFLRPRDISYRHLINLVSKYFQSNPYIILQEDLFKDLPSSITFLESVIGGKGPDVDSIDMKSFNKGVLYHQSRLLIMFNKLSRSELNPDGFIPFSNIYTRTLRVTPRDLCQNILSGVSKRPIILDDDVKGRIKTYYKEDWEYMLDVKNRHSN